MAYLTKTVAVSSLDEHQKAAMLNLYLSNYDGSNPTLFLGDLMEKDEVLLLEWAGQLVGFTTYLIYAIEWQNSSVRIVYSGDTIVDRAHWGQQALAFAWIARIGEIKRQEPQVPFYWFLLVKGHRTFKYMPVFVKSFYPHWRVERADLKHLAEYLAHQKFGADFHPQTGVVAFAHSRGHLKSNIAEATPEERNKDSVRFFLQRNPHYRLGHELVCLCELEASNMKPLTQRIFNGGFSEKRLA